jgi:hypothetical protein
MVEAAILRTVLYADIFHFPLTLDELHFFLIHHEPITQQTLLQTLQASSRLQTLLCQQDGYLALSHRADIITLRQQRETIAQKLLPKAQHYGRLLGYIPYVRMVALTGALAMRNPAHEKDDIDYLMVVENGRVWMARAFAIVLVRWARLWGVELCPNYVLATNKLVQTRCDLYIAHEVAQMIPLYDEHLYEAMLNANTWASALLPHLTHRHSQLSKPTQRLKKRLEQWLNGAWGEAFEQWEYRRKSKKFAPVVNTRQSSAEIDAQTVKGHFNDHGQRVLAQYHAKLQEYGLV